MEKTIRTRFPQDELYGPLVIPEYCWPIIDCPEFQRLRSIMQLGPVHYIYAGATHSRFEHSLGVAHLANKFMEHINSVQPELGIEPKHSQAVVLAGLCHDLGHGPWSHTFCSFLSSHHCEVVHEERSIEIFELIVSKYKIEIDPDVVRAVGNFILGLEAVGFPEWMSHVVADHSHDVDIDKFDYLGRDTNRALGLTRFEYERLILNARIVENEIAWKVSDMSLLDRMFFNRNDMFRRVYQHRVVHAIECMICDCLEAANEKLHLTEAGYDLDMFLKMDDRLMHAIENGEAGEEAQKIALRIVERKFYKCVGEIRLRSDNAVGLSYSQKPCEDMQEDIAEQSGHVISADLIRVGKASFRYGLKNRHPLLDIPFWHEGGTKVEKVTSADLSSIAPVHFQERALRVYSTDPECYDKALMAFNIWKRNKCQQ